MRRYLSIAFSWPVVRRALGYAVVVGALLVVLNHGDALLAGEVDARRWVKMSLTVVVPYLVSTLSSVSAKLEGEGRIDAGQGPLG